MSINKKKHAFVELLQSKDLDKLLEFVDAERYLEPLQEMLQDIDREKEDDTDPVLFFVRARLHQRLEAYEKSLDDYLHAAKMGYCSAYYFAGNMAEDHPLPGDWTSSKLHKLGSINGHLFSRQIISAEDRKAEGKIKAEYIWFRFFKGPILVLIYGVLRGKYKDRYRV